MRTLLLAILTAAGVLACSIDEDQVPVSVRVGTNAWRVIEVDKCIAPIIDALQKGGIKTITSCCGHGTNGYIVLEDRILTLSPQTNRAAVNALYLERWNDLGETMEQVRENKARGIE
jgi:hypothetical protein